MSHSNGRFEYSGVSSKYFHIIGFTSTLRQDSGYVRGMLAGELAKAVAKALGQHATALASKAFFWSAVGMFTTRAEAEAAAAVWHAMINLCYYKTLTYKDKAGDVVPLEQEDQTEALTKNLKELVTDMAAVETNDPRAKGNYMTHNGGTASSMFAGVCWDKRSGLWRAQVRATNGVTRYYYFAAYFPTEEAAARARDHFVVLAHHQGLRRKVDTNFLAPSVEEAEIFKAATAEKAASGKLKPTRPSAAAARAAKAAAAAAAAPAAARTARKRSRAAAAITDDSDSADSCSSDSEPESKTESDNETESGALKENYQAAEPTRRTSRVGAAAGVARRRLAAAAAALHDEDEE